MGRKLLSSQFNIIILLVLVLVLFFKGFLLNTLDYRFTYAHHLCRHDSPSTNKKAAFVTIIDKKYSKIHSEKFVW